MTEKALLIKWDGLQYWLPVSQVSDPDNYEAGDKDVTVSITEWIAGEKGIEVDS